ncbi:hypothetical protein [Alkalihalobacillus sp. AL-G]|uniref:hypothetical protein n=1 Tax=Alkalihalobacillus sp. AL-G TaxID=2926399 RepID=UPI00272B4600|nr:hypothetical protein [Alkalihalobacillus sp. AL-G]WLD92581.1 hypothetical protein MOJ78_16405 [Alkalihalobacillus sp. AL-G]
MSEYKEFLSEREKIDYLLEKGFDIKRIQENLSGAFVRFQASDRETETLHVKTAEGRKYVSNLFIKQRLNV